MSAVPPAILKELEEGVIETATLAETLAVDFATLASNVFPQLPDHALDALRAEEMNGVTKRMREAANVMTAHLAIDDLRQAPGHTSDIVRGWAAYTTPLDAPLGEQLEAIRPAAADSHFGVREWAWLAVRPSICADPVGAVQILTSWAADGDPNIRRFASEATRPRGVWATHISQFKNDPEPAAPILDQLCLDPDDYVHRSVANWMRDASKTDASWVASTLDRWQTQHGDHPLLGEIQRRSTT